MKLIKIKAEQTLIIKEWIENKEDLIQFSGTFFSFPIIENELIKLYSKETVHPYFLLDDDENPIAIADIYTGDPIPRLCRILMNKKFRSKGYGQIFVKLLIDEILNNYESKKVELFVIENNLQAKYCYEKVGFKIQNHKNSSFEINSVNYKILSYIYNS